MLVGGGGGGPVMTGEETVRDCSSLTLSHLQGAWPNFGTSADQINWQSPPLEKKNLSNQGKMIFITCCCVVGIFETF